MNKESGKKVVYKSVKEMPPMAASFYSMRYNKTGSWRNLKPVINYEKCTYCMICWKFCPEPAISLEPVIIDGKEKPKPVIDYDYCKGCGICWVECPVQAIDHIEEER